MNFTTTGNNGISYSINGSPFKPNTMEQGSIFSNSIHSYTNIPSNFTTKKTWGNSSDQYIKYKKIQSIGENKRNIGLPIGSPLSYKSTENNSRKTAISRVRGGGAVAPKKKGAVRI